MHNQLLDLDGNKEKLISGRAELPFHSDGSIFQKKIDIIFLYASEIENLKFQGGTVIVDIRSALEEMPLHLKRILNEESFELLGIEKGYYPEGVEPFWYQLKTFTDYGWTLKYNIYSNYKDSSKGIGWITRVRGFNKIENERFFNELDSHFSNYKYAYTHYWKKGDLIILDNRRCIHSRQAYDDTSRRLIFRIQLNES
jgi:(5R)-carbapenem-3-carboxylate synthase